MKVPGRTTRRPAKRTACGALSFRAPNVIPSVSEESRAGEWRSLAALGMTALVSPAVALRSAGHQLSAMPPLVQLAIAQFMPRKGDYRANLDRLRTILAQADALDPRPDVLHLP